MGFWRVIGKHGCKNAATLNALSNSCSTVAQITQTVCMAAVANWCKQYGNSTLAGMVTGQTADNEYTVGCVSGFCQAATCSPPAGPPTCADQGLTDCNGVCVDLLTDASNCGACGVVCPQGPGSCLGGFCPA